MRRPSIAAAILAVAPAVVLVAWHRRRKRHRRLTVPAASTEESANNNNNIPADAYDVIIVGAGPAGSTLAYFLAKQSPAKKILLLERKAFPRNKYCGDAWCAPALDILENMEWSPNTNVSVLDEMERQGLCRPVRRGGFVSPFGHVCINAGDGEATTYGSSKAVRTYAIKRVIADEYLARAAQRAGVELREECEADVAQVSFHKSYWQVPVKQQPHGPTTAVVVTGRMLVAADGATSYLARHLGLVQTDADATCSHRYVKGGTHGFTADGVMFFNRSVLPGYSALFRHYNDDMYLGTYVLPGGRATSRCIAGFENELVQRHPLVRDAFGGKDCAQAAWRVDEGENGRLKTAPIRCGGEEKTYGDHFLVVGDAAGQTDPMTGEGIHTAMIAATLAAETIEEMFACRNFSVDATRVYHERWLEAFGRDFRWSAAGAHLIYRFPILLDAACSYGEKKGQSFLDEFGQIMTGVKPKLAFLNPSLAVPISFYLVREIFLQYVLRRVPLVPQDIGLDLVTKHSKT